MVPFEKRKIEWGMFSGSFIYGGAMMLPFESLSPTAQFNSYVLTRFSEFTWGTSFFLSGVVGLIALCVNGRSALSPFFRFFTSLALSFLLIHYAYLFAVVNPFSVSVIVYGVWLGVICGSISMYGASKDMLNEIEIWKEHRHGRNQPS